MIDKYQFSRFGLVARETRGVFWQTAVKRALSHHLQRLYSWTTPLRHIGNCKSDGMEFSRGQRTDAHAQDSACFQSVARYAPATQPKLLQNAAADPRLENTVIVYYAIKLNA